MSAIAEDVRKQSPTGRMVTIEALDAFGDPAGADIEVLVNGAPAGVIDLGTGTRDVITIEVSDGQAEIALRARFLIETQTLVLPPSQGRAVFRFGGSVRYAAARKPVATCPDGSSGSPCVTCHGAGGVSWRMCC